MNAGRHGELEFPTCHDGFFNDLGMVVGKGICASEGTLSHGRDFESLPSLVQTCAPNAALLLAKAVLRYSSRSVKGLKVRADPSESPLLRSNPLHAECIAVADVIKVTIDW